MSYKRPSDWRTIGKGESPKEYPNRFDATTGENRRWAFVGTSNGGNIPPRMTTLGGKVTTYKL